VKRTSGPEVNETFTLWLMRMPSRWVTICGIGCDDFDIACRIDGRAMNIAHDDNRGRKKYR
jgi:hypothetical protein